jgi:hypothetical protein
MAAATVELHARWTHPRLDRILRRLSAAAGRWPYLACAIFDLGHRLEMRAGGKQVWAGRVRLHARIAYEAEVQ